jgi:hypothetical protein
MKRKHRSGDMKYSENELRAYYNKAKSTRESSQIRLQEKNLELLYLKLHIRETLRRPKMLLMGGQMYRQEIKDTVLLPILPSTGATPVF